MRISVVLALLLAGCGTASDPQFPMAIPHPDPAREKDENDIRVIAFKHMLDRAGAGEVCFIEVEDVNGWANPSDQFMSRLDFPRLILRKVNEARHPAQFEMDPEDPKRYQGIRDPKTGKRCYVYWVRVEWLTSDKVKAHAGFTGGPLSGGGSELILVRENGAWVFKKLAGSWAN